MITFQVHTSDQKVTDHTERQAAVEEYAFQVTMSVSSKHPSYRDQAVTLLAVDDDGNEEVLYEHIVAGG